MSSAAGAIQRQCAGRSFLRVHPCHGTIRAHIGRWHATHAPAAPARLRDVARRLLPGFVAPSPMRIPTPGPLPKGSQDPMATLVFAHPGGPALVHCSCLPKRTTLNVSHVSILTPSAPSTPRPHAETHACIVAVLFWSWLAYSYLNGLVPLRFISFLPLISIVTVTPHFTTINSEDGS